MADITNEQAVRFCDENVRVMADSLSQAYFTAKSLLADWDGLSMSSLICNDSSPIKDAANPTAKVAADGRPPIVGSDVHNLVNRASEIVADFEANSNAKLNAVLAVRVNGQPLF